MRFLRHALDNSENSTLQFSISLHAWRHIWPVAAAARHPLAEQIAHQEILPYETCSCPHEQNKLISSQLMRRKRPLTAAFAAALAIEHMNQRQRELLEKQRASNPATPSPCRTVSTHHLTSHPQTRLRHTSALLCTTPFASLHTDNQISPSPLVAPGRTTSDTLQPRQ